MCAVGTGGAGMQLRGPAAALDGGVRGRRVRAQAHDGEDAPGEGVGAVAEDRVGRSEADRMWR